MKISEVKKLLPVHMQAQLGVASKPPKVWVIYGRKIQTRIVEKGFPVCLSSGARIYIAERRVCSAAVYVYIFNTAMKSWKSCSLMRRHYSYDEKLLCFNQFIRAL